MGTADGKQARGIGVFKADRYISTTETRAAVSAVKEFPAEEWEEKSRGVFVSKTRTPINKEQQKVFDKELSMAQIAAQYKHTVYMLPETSKGKKNPDTIMDGVKTEFKAITGGLNAVGKRFNEAMQQGKNVFLKIDSELKVHDIYKKIRGEILFHSYKSGNIYVYMNNKMYKWDIQKIK